MGNFGEDTMPFGEYFDYTIQNVEVSDNNFFLTVIYSGQNTLKDQYLKHWMNKHPGLLDFRSKTNFREVTTADPMYQSYLGTAVPQTPAVLITTPADNGPFGKTVYLAYGESLSTDPNLIASQMETATQQTYQPQTIQQLPPSVPYVPQTVRETNHGWLVVVVLVVALLFAFNRRRRR